MSTNTRNTYLIEGARQVLSADIVRLCGWEVRQSVEMRLTKAVSCIHTHLVKPVTPTSPEECLHMLTSPDEVLK